MLIGLPNMSPEIAPWGLDADAAQEVRRVVSVIPYTEKSIHPVPIMAFHGDSDGLRSV
jgi:hypothetical protein